MARHNPSRTISIANSKQTNNSNKPIGKLANTKLANTISKLLLGWSLFNIFFTPLSFTPYTLSINPSILVYGLSKKQTALQTSYNDHNQQNVSRTRPATSQTDKQSFIKHFRDYEKVKRAVEYMKNLYPDIDDTHAKVKDWLKYRLEDIVSRIELSEEEFKQLWPNIRESKREVFPEEGYSVIIKTYEGFEPFYYLCSTYCGREFCKGLSDAFALYDLRSRTTRVIDLYDAVTNAFLHWRAGDYQNARYCFERAFFFSLLYCSRNNDVSELLVFYIKWVGLMDEYAKPTQTSNNHAPHKSNKQKQ